MSRINHTRPQLRFLDNMRREFDKLPNKSAKPRTEEPWPTYLQPVVLRKDSHKAFSELFEAIIAWSDSEGIVSFSDFPEQLKKAASDFANVRVHHDYDNKYRGQNWVADLCKSHNEEQRAWGELLNLFITRE